MPEQLWFTAILNQLFAAPVTALLTALHLPPKYPAQPIPNSFSMELLVFVFLLILFLLVRARLSADAPNGLQHVVESIEGFVQGQSNEIIGHHSEGYTSFLSTLFFFILLCNLIGVIPGFESPTGATLSCSVPARSMSIANSTWPFNSLTPRSGTRRFGCQPSDESAP